MYYIIGKTYTKDGLCYKVLDTDDMQSVVVNYSDLVATIQDNTPMKNASLEGYKVQGTDYNLDNLGEVGSEDIYLRVRLGKDYIYVSQNENIIKNHKSIKKYRTVYDVDKFKTKSYKLKMKLDNSNLIKVEIEEYKNDKILRLHDMGNVYSKILNQCSMVDDAYIFYYAIYEVYELSSQIFELLTLDSILGLEPYIGVLVRYNKQTSTYDGIYVVPNPAKKDIQDFGNICKSVITRVTHENKTYTEGVHTLVNKVF